MQLPEDGLPKEEAVYDAPPTFSPYSPDLEEDSVQPTSPGPAQSSDAPGLGDTSGADGEKSEETGSEPRQPLPEFSPQHREAFEGLLYLGRLEESFTKWGHRFVIRTLTTEQLAEIGMIVKPYQGTQAEMAVYQTAVVAAAVVSVDGKPLPGSILVDNSDELATVRFPYVLKNWMPPVREGIYERSWRLELTAREVLKAMGEASG